MSSSTISKNSQLYSGYDNRSTFDSQVYPLLYNADVWVDASDTSTFTTTGTGIQRVLASNWNDKSVNANHLVRTGAGSIYYDDGNNGFAMNGQYFTPTTVVQSSNTESFFLVLGFWGSTQSGTQYVLGTNAALVANHRTFRIDTAGLLTLSGTTSVLTGSSPVLEGRRYLVEYTNNNGFLQHFINGRLTGGVSGTTFTSTSTITGFFGGNSTLRAVVHECLFYSSCVSSNHRQLIENYLINKWKVPATTIANPTSVSGCRLWLDASDSSSITLSGSNVTSWNDKSGFSNHATGITSFLPTYTSGTPQINFNTTQGLTTPYVPAAGGETIFVVLKTTTIAAASQYFIDSSNTATGRNIRITGAGGNRWVVSIAGADRLSGIIGITSQSYATNVLYCGVLAGSGGVTQFINKVRDTLSTATNTPGASTYTQIGSRGTTPATGLNGSISEIVAYNTVLTASDRELVANYLINKWSISCLSGTLINVYNAFQRIPPRVRYFTPNDIDNCSLWLDAADRNTLYQNSTGTTLVTATGQTVNFWRDKSPTGCNATNSSNLGGLSAYSSMNGLDSISFAINSYFTLTPSLMPTGTQYGISVFIVCITTIAANQCVISWGSGDANNTTTVFYGYQLDSPNNSSRPFAGQVSGTGINNTSLSKNNIILLSSTSTSSTQRPVLLKGWLNGTAFNNGTSSTTFVSPIGTTFASIGGYFGTSPSTNYLTGNIGEIIVYNRYLGNSEKEQIEGYLANKWGLRSTLPSLHTIKDINTLAAPFNPKSISMCTFWYDIADSSTITYAAGSTVNVTGVKDKSGFGVDLNRVTYTAGREMTTANTLNGLPTLTFPGDPADNNNTLTYLTSTTPTIPLAVNANYVFFVMRFNPFVLEGTTTARSWNFIYPLSIFSNYGLQGGLFRTTPNWNINYGAAFVGNNANSTAVVSNRANGPATGTPIMCMFGKTAAAQYVFSFNGTYETKAGQNYPMVGGSTMHVGVFYQAQELCEMFMLQGRLLSLGEIQKIEGYLAWKWGLTANLPSTHAYKKYPP